MPRTKMMIIILILTTVIVITIITLTIVMIIELVQNSHRLIIGFVLAHPYVIYSFIFIQLSPNFFPR